MHNKKIRAHRMMGQIPLEKEFRGHRIIRSIVNRLIHAAARYLPMFPAWRVAIHRYRGVKIEDNVFIGSDVFIDNTYPESIIIRDGVTIISRSFIIGHNFIPFHLQGILKSRTGEKMGVTLESGCYIGAQCILMPGVKIGKCAVIGAGSIVTGDIPDYSLAFGSPAKVFRTFTQQEIETTRY